MICYATKQSLNKKLAGTYINFLKVNILCNIIKLRKADSFAQFNNIACKALGTASASLKNHLKEIYYKFQNEKKLFEEFDRIFQKILSNIF